MKVVLINKTASGGGAAMASKRLLNALLKTDKVQPFMLVQEYNGTSESIYSTTHSTLKRWINFFRFVWERLCFLPFERSKEIRFAYSLANTGENISKLSVIKNAGIIHLHWFNQGFLSLKNIEQLISLNKPIVWTMHDMWAFTGGCHYSGNCNSYQTGCHTCPFLRTPSSRDLSSRLFAKKMKLLASANITYVGCSNWMANEARSSFILKNATIVSIPNPINTELYKPVSKVEARQKFNLPTNKKIILFGAAKITDKRKGLDYLVKAIDSLAEQQASELLLVTFGRAVGLPELPIDCISINYISNESDIIQLYNAADVFVVPSLEDNLPNTIMESLACGTPVVAFNTGGIPEMVEHKKTGYLATLKDANDLANGILWILDNNTNQMLSNAAREKALNDYSEIVVTQKFVSLYSNLLPTL